MLKFAKLHESKKGEGGSSMTICGVNSTEENSHQGMKISFPPAEMVGSCIAAPQIVFIISFEKCSVAFN